MASALMTDADVVCADQLLAEIRSAPNGATFTAVPFPAISSMSLSLSYNGVFGPGTPCLGCAVYFPVTNHSFHYDFTASHDPDFAPFVARLTDGRDQVLLEFLSTLDINGVQHGIAGGGNLESGRFGTPSDLVGRNIDRIRLTAEGITFSSAPANSDVITEYRYSFASVTWQIYGSGLPAPGPPPLTSVPEPSVLFLFGTGLAVLLATRLAVPGRGF
jgi:hypothetical protein